MSFLLKTKISPLSLTLRLLMVVWLLCCARAPSSYAGNLDVLHNLVGNKDAVLVSDWQGKTLFAKNAKHQLVPASTLKLLTALAAMRYLGPDYRFITEFYLDRNHNLIVKGYGDPLLISEVMANIVAKLAARLDSKHPLINDLVLDETYFADPIVIPGVTSSYEPYDAPNGALCVNFNTVNFKRNTNGTYASAEPQTPLLPLVIPRIQASRLDQGRIILSRKENESTLYAGHLLLYFMQQQGMHFSGNIRIGRVQNEFDQLIFRYVSEFSMAQIISKLLEHSNNFMANQLLITAGAKAYGPPGTLSKGVRAVSVFANDVLKLPNIHIVEGSGISRENRISAQDLLAVLEAFAPYYRLMPGEGKAFYKTGTLSGIHTRAGYIENQAGKIYRFVILINTPGKSADHIMDILLHALE
jgi:D-alanyl-D-alanine carboxypeptidase/D-alanyl-D-alanine-endopeptidase (penicillin-binding protein 4)